MKRSIVLLLLFFSCASLASAETSQKPIFGPKKFNVTQRHGEENRFREEFAATEEVYLIKFQNGESTALGPTFMKLSLNGQIVLKEDRYEYPFLVCIVQLAKTNVLELALKDMKPMTATPPKPQARLTQITVIQNYLPWPEGLYGAQDPEKLKELERILQKIKKPETLSLAMNALNLKQDLQARAEAMRRLSGRKDAQAQDFLTFLRHDPLMKPELKSEVALALGALGDKKSIPDLMDGLLDEQESVRKASAQALSWYPEEDTREQLTKLLMTLDSMRVGAILTTISDSGWRPFDTILKLTDSADATIQNTSLLMLGHMKNPRAVKNLLGFLKEPGKRDRNIIIRALGASQDPAVVGPLSELAGNPAQRAGVEIELANAFAALGDRKTAPLIGAMIDTGASLEIRRQLRAAYRKLMGKKYEK